MYILLYNVINFPYSPNHLSTRPNTALNRPNLAQIAIAVQKLLLDKSLTTPCLFGDERDATIAKWNQLQAGYGYGRAYYTQQGAFVQISADNPYCRLKVGYIVLLNNIQLPVIQFTTLSIFFRYHSPPHALCYYLLSLPVHLSILNTH